MATKDVDLPYEGVHIGSRGRPHELNSGPSASWPGCHCWIGGGGCRASGARSAAEGPADAQRGTLLHLATTTEEWIIGQPESLPRRKNLPDLRVTPSPPFVLTALNSSASPRCFHITSLNPLRGCRGSLERGSARTKESGEVECTTLVLLVPPRTQLDVATIEASCKEEINVASDVFEWAPPPSSARGVVYFDTLPLLGGGPFLCSQGVGGGLTHFAHPSTFHAIDFECDVGTPVVAVADGVVVEISQVASFSFSETNRSPSSNPRRTAAM